MCGELSVECLFGGPKGGQPMTCVVSAVPSGRAARDVAEPRAHAAQIDPSLPPKPYRHVLLGSCGFC